MDGGYVFCELPAASDAGPNGDGGVANWLCDPGTYFCDLGGDIGNCFQCRSDADCAHRFAPTYEPGRPHCDLTSGIAGYQGFCQECLANSDCSGNAGGRFCDLNPTIPEALVDSSLETVGFETCIRITTDCRLDGGPACGLDQFCDASSGQCLARSGSCVSDQDCAGFYSLTNYNVPAPHCVSGACSPCPSETCPALAGYPCHSDADCGNPTSSDAGLTCDMDSSECVCTDSSQCIGAWPVCEGLDGGNVNRGGEPIGLCGCGSDMECGDAGGTCFSPGTSGSFCGVPCTAPGFPPCSGYQPICDADSGFCMGCAVDFECQASHQPDGPLCDADGSGEGYCGCLQDSDCPASETCQGGSLYGACSPLQHCTVDSCVYYTCDWQNGDCLNGVTSSPAPVCITDYDCTLPEGIGKTVAPGTGPFCDSSTGTCVECLSNADCVLEGEGPQGMSACCLSSAKGCSLDNCTPFCGSDSDCIGNAFGSSCLLDAGSPHCANFCTSDSDCLGNAGGPRCDLDSADPSFGRCACEVPSDCPAGWACATDGGRGASCSNYCSADSDCVSGYFCENLHSICRPRCDGTNHCQGPDTICDSANAAGQNGLGADPSAIWCYACLQGSDCDGGLGCVSPAQTCQACAQDSDCASGGCLDGTCLTPCRAGACPGSQVCDTQGVAGRGAGLCYDCLGPIDCPPNQGCNSQSHTCGTCTGPNVDGGPFDCPPGTICSKYWSTSSSGVCLQYCDVFSCPDSQPICGTLPALTPDHKFCFGCLQDSDCTDAGASTVCDVSVDLTFACVNPLAP